MSRYIDRSEYRDSYQLNDRVSFMHYGTRLYGEIARTYNGNPCAFHVEVDGRRYEVDLHADELRMEE